MAKTLGYLLFVLPPRLYSRWHRQRSNKKNESWLFPKRFHYK